MRDKKDIRYLALYGRLENSGIDETVDIVNHFEKIALGFKQHVIWTAQLKEKASLYLRGE